MLVKGSTRGHRKKKILILEILLSMITREINFYLTPTFNKCPLCIKRFNIILRREETLSNTDTLSHCFLSIVPTPMHFFLNCIVLSIMYIYVQIRVWTTHFYITTKVMLLLI